jgi:hypothetical protein
MIETKSRLLRSVIIFFIMTCLVITASACQKTSSTSSYQPRFTEMQVGGLVESVLMASGDVRLYMLARDGSFDAELDVSRKQWIVTYWTAEEMQRNKSAGRIVNTGSVFIVDDITGKVLNPP